MKDLAAKNVLVSSDKMFPILQLVHRELAAMNVLVSADRMFSILQLVHGDLAARNLYQLIEFSVYYSSCTETLQA